jgi:hypothetical protein
MDVIKSVQAFQFSSFDNSWVNCGIRWINPEFIMFADSSACLYQNLGQNMIKLILKDGTELFLTSSDFIKLNQK